MLRFDYIKRTLQFNFPAKTSRGAISTKDCFLVKVWDEDTPEIIGWGECNTLKGLSIDHFEDYEVRLQNWLNELNRINVYLEDLPNLIDKEKLPSFYFAIETALLDLKNGGKKIIYDNSFYKGTPIPINGLVWMGDHSFMKEQIDQKLEKGFDCIKIKVGALDFEQELSLLKYIRSEYSSDKITLRVDANGAFNIEEALEKLKRLSDFELHSIEQPIWAGQWEEMAKLCEVTPIPIALDEELIGVSSNKKEALLDTIKPQYIILKPALVGGLEASAEWITSAEKRNIPWWMTSALESNIGLNAIAQFTANYLIDKPHGLGTGQLYHNNFESPLTVAKGELYYNCDKSFVIN
ncbi:o-succinylbenzoate synthase [Flammeovirga agarivorans]|uniref:O-succinylbenzoate synthase n=1 Tax=Flammeovirga agarivorans TaxID=2726742 RepID=A0A7X8SLV5_9BACT|nr:o-succinylbenzoate synthase [Flammeovirga agarivorans]NLR92532.1 o-succinylbenzoate synthase [Flammeovirga agarivorans]